MSVQSDVGRDRPPGPAPRGTAWGLGAIMLVSLLAFPSAVFAGADWLPLNLDTLLGVTFGSVLAAMLCVMPLAAGVRTRRYWVVCWFFSAGVACLLLTFAALVSGCLAPLGLVQRLHPQYVGLVDFGRALWLPCAVMSWAPRQSPVAQLLAALEHARHLGDGRRAHGRVGVPGGRAAHRRPLV